MVVCTCGKRVSPDIAFDNNAVLFFTFFGVANQSARVLKTKDVSTQSSRLHLTSSHLVRGTSWSRVVLKDDSVRGSQMSRTWPAGYCATVSKSNNMRAETNYFHHDKLRGTVEALASRTGSESELSPKHMRLLMFLLGNVFADGLPGPLWRPRTSFTAFVRRRFVADRCVGLEK
jgi:hypothetical protein